MDIINGVLAKQSPAARFSITPADLVGPWAGYAGPEMTLFSPG